MDLAEKYTWMTAAEMAAEWQYKRSIWSIHSMAKKLHVKKTAEWRREKMRQIQLLRPTEKTVATRFCNGHVPVNKGKPYQVADGANIGTRFQKGHRPWTWVPVGTIGINKGYYMIKVRDESTSGRNFIPLHRAVWMANGRDIPAGCTITFRNGDRTDLRLDNLECISRRELARRNSLHQRYPPELRDAARVISVLSTELRSIHSRITRGQPCFSATDFNDTREKSSDTK